MFLRAAHINASVQIRATRIAAVIIAVTLILISIYCRLRLLAVPLERDEGGFAYIAQQMLNGTPPFESGYSMKLIGIHAAYALFLSLFGQTPAAIHGGLLLVNLASIILLYFLARRLLPYEGAVLASGVFALLSVSQDVQGIFAHATHLVILFVLAGLVALFAWREKGYPFLLVTCGICMGTSVAMKQNGLFYCMLALFMLIMELKRRKDPLRSASVTVLIWIAGVITPCLLILLYVTFEGVIAQFWFWTFEYAFEYSSGNSLAESLYWLSGVIPLVTKTTLPFWCVAAAGVFAIPGKEAINRDRWFLPLFMAVSFLAITPGGYFYPHYFVLLLPALSLLCGAAYIGFVSFAGLFISSAVSRWLAVGIIAMASVVVVDSGRSYLFHLAPEEVIRLLYGDNPFAESSQVIARYISTNSSPEDRVVVLGSEPQIYFYSGRQAATKHLFVYPLMEAQPRSVAMRNELFAEITSTIPKYIILSFQYSSWLAVPDEIVGLLAPMRVFLDENYTTVGVIDIIDGKVSYYWGGDAEDFIPLSVMPIYILERTSDRNG